MLHLRLLKWIFTSKYQIYQQSQNRERMTFHGFVLYVANMWTQYVNNLRKLEDQLNFKFSITIFTSVFLIFFFYLMRFETPLCPPPPFFIAININHPNDMCTFWRKPLNRMKKNNNEIWAALSPSFNTIDINHSNDASWTWWRKIIMPFGTALFPLFISININHQNTTFEQDEETDN